MKRFCSIILSLVMIFTSLTFINACVENPPNEQKYIVWFDTCFDDVTVEPMESLPQTELELPIPSKDGYRFEGWIYGENPNFLDMLIMPSFDLTLTAVWSRFSTITFNSDGGGVVLPIQAYSGDAIIAPTEPYKEDYIFTGWLLNGLPFVFSTMPYEDIVLVASYQKGISISFDTDDEYIKIDTLVGKAGDKVVAPADPHRDGYTFLGWYLNGGAYTFNVFPQDDIVLVAKWTKNYNLPVININLFDHKGDRLSINSVTRENYVTSRISVSNTDSEYLLNQENAQFKGRGHGSWETSKKGYRIKFDKKHSLFGEQKSKHWVLNAGTTNQNDISMARNYTAFGIAKNCLSAIEYVTSTHYVDLYFNGVYHGVYIVFEHIRVDEGRVDIESEFGVTDTGYLIEYDAYAVQDGGVEGIDYFRISGYRYYFVVGSPDPEDYEEEGISLSQYKAQVNFIKDYTTLALGAVIKRDFETFKKYADVDSFVDMYLLHEIFKNTDTGWSSFYMYKKKGGKLFAGPPWDFDLSAGGNRGDNSPQGLYVGVQKHGLVPDTNSELYINLMQTSGFQNAVKERFKQVAPSIQAYINLRLSDHFIESNLTVMGLNYAKWTDYSLDYCKNYWSSAVISLRTWLTQRLSWLTSYWNTSP